MLKGLSDGALLGVVLGLLLGNADDTVLESEMALTTDQDLTRPMGLPKATQTASYLVPTKAQPKEVSMVSTTGEWTGTRRETLMVLSWA